ncbi:hypothetical protein S7335_4046 [Synechococcus sp. PCC 7335]|uniref:hypothetical protein n=1 Tax=Synechococcus sp. (strain ATCC 29403 / PCC 7335) TaxID=91464 RepID=UPI00017ED222|nr:hypothetical protein [Synechococcus sp. PCC 7335]EDX86343.1 hypothetical protein S7335_4046 [Synechococcus sp. PCC 7335]
MNRPRILEPQASYTFSKYFELTFDAEDVFAELGCGFERTALELPQTSQPIDFKDELHNRLQTALKVTNLMSEMARREALIAPILFAVCGHIEQELKIEYRVEVSPQLKGTLDYYIPSPQNLLVIEAKNADLGRGFTQLGAELIALDQWTQQDTPIIYGAVTTGDSWRFGQFFRAERKILQDTKLYSIPLELEKLLSVLLGIIQRPES